MMNDIDMSVAMVNAAQARWRAYGAEMERRKRAEQEYRKKLAVSAVMFAGRCIAASAFGFVLLCGLMMIANVVG